jgi:hypothetical protein
MSSMEKNRTAQGAFFRLCVLIGFAAFFFGLILAMLATANSQTLVRTFPRNLGQRVYPTGATPTPTPTPCPPVGSWTEQAPYPIAVFGNAVASQGGNVFGFGGITNNIAIANAYKYTPTTNTWVPIAPLPAPRGWFSAASDGTNIYLLGGVDQNFATTATLWRYDPTSNTYNTSLPSYTIPTYFHASAYLNGKIYRIAGRAIGTDFHVEVYDIATNAWSMAANYPFANHSLMAVALGNYVYAGGGNASPDKTYRYDPGTNTWDDGAIADLPAGRSAAASGAHNGRWLLAGGDVNFAVSNSVIALDPATNTWTNLPNMIQARDYLEGATAGQSFYAVAGTSGPGTPTNDNQQYTETPCPPMASSAFSRKVHGGAGPFDIPLPLTGSVGVECRSGGATNDYQMIINFMNPVTVANASVTSGTGSVSSFTVSGSQVTVNLTGITNVQRITVTLFNVNDGTHMGNVPVSMGVLVGDVNGNAAVNASDVSLTKAQLGQGVGSSNFREDVNANGVINVADVAQIKTNLGSSLPP